MHDPLYQALADWIDAVLVAQLPDGIAAFHFNLYEGIEFELQLIGAPTYLADDDDWACDDIFMSDDPRFELPRSVVGETWERGLAAANDLLARYMSSDRAGAVRLRQSQAVSVGFVDGDLQLVWAAD